MQPWKTSVICAGKYRPRQFEYHPLHEDVLVFGTLKGEAVVADVATNRVCSSIGSGLAKDRHDSILGLCWLKKYPNRFVVGSSHGFLRLCDAGPLGTGRERWAGAEAAASWKGTVDGEELRSGRRFDKRRSTSMDDFRGRQRAGPKPAGGAFGRMATSGYPVTGSVKNGNAAGEMDARFSQVGTIVKEFEQFEKLTSVHVNSIDEHMLASGYTYGVRLFDLHTGKVVRNFSKIHEDHINISRFANHSPFVFATSSFDHTVKAWDSRLRADRSPIYTCRSELGHVMLSFSPDDVFLLTSAVDNEIKQYLAVDGRLHMDLDVPKTGLDENFTRSYYTSSGRLILSGSSEEQTVRLYCAQTGRLVHSADMYPGRKHGSLYVQSLRGDPHHDFQFSVLVNYRDTAYPLEIVKVDMLKGNDGEDLRPLMTYASSSRLAADLGRACLDKEGADVSLVARDGSRFLAHELVLSCRSPVLGALVEEARKASLAEGAGEASMEVEGTAEPSGSPSIEIGASGDGAATVGAAPASRAAPPGAEMLKVCLPLAVAPEVVPVVLTFLYKDELETNSETTADGDGEVYVDPGNKEWEDSSLAALLRNGGVSSGSMAWWRAKAGANGGAWRPGGGGDDVERHCGMETTREVLVCEKVLEAARALRLHRLYTLVEWRCRELVNNVTVVAVSHMSFRQQTEQLLRYCIYYLVTHLKMVRELHGTNCLAPYIHAQVCAERQRRVYSLSRDPSNTGAAAGPASNGFPEPPYVARGALRSTRSARSQEGTVTGAVGVVNNALDGALAVAAAAVEAAWTQAHQAFTGGADGGRGVAGAGQEGVVEVEPEGGDAAHDAQAVGPPVDRDEERSDVDVNEEPALFGDDDDGLGVGDGDNQPYEGQAEQEAVNDLELDFDVFNDVEDAGADDDDDNFVDEEVEEEGHGSTSDDESITSDDDDDSGTSQVCGGGLTGLLRRRLIPKVTGHTATAVLGSQMIVLGGGNKRQFHGCRHVPVYDPLERTWSKLATRGNAPQALIYHSTTALEPPWSQPRNLLVFGGNSARHLPSQSPAQAQVIVLDTLTMEWSKPIVEGQAPGIRTRHTAVGVHSDDSHHVYASWERQQEETSVSLTMKPSMLRDAQASRERREAGTSGGKASSQDGQSASREHGCRTSPSLREVEGDTDVIIFGGYSPPEGQAYNDVLVLSVRRSRAKNTSGSSNAQGSNGFMGTGSGHSQAQEGSGNRRVGESDSDEDEASGEDCSDGNDPGNGTFDRRPWTGEDPGEGRSNASQTETQRRLPGQSASSRGGASGPSSGTTGAQGLDPPEPGGTASKSVDGIYSRNGTPGNEGYRYRWVRPLVRGTPPETRLAHAAAVVRLAEEDFGGGAGLSKKTYMVVFGGVGTGALYNDTHLLRRVGGNRCGSVCTMQWEARVQVRGRPPSRRYGHSMTTLNPSKCLAYAKLAVFGGTSGESAFNDMFLLTISWGIVDGQSSLMASWESISKEIEGPMPCLRSRQTMCYVNGELLIFGGSDEAIVADVAAHNRNREVDTHVYHLRPRLKRRPMGERWVPLTSLRVRHEVSMARDVSILLRMVEKAERERTGAPAANVAVGRRVSTSREAGTMAPSTASRAGGASTIARGGGRESSGQSTAAAAVNPHRLQPLDPTGTASRAFRMFSNRNAVRASQTRGEKPKPVMCIQVVWECVKPETFVYEAGPEPPVVVKPMTLHRDMQSLVGSTLFSDIKFRFQAVDYNEPTTPSNTAHYALVPRAASPERSPGLAPLVSATAGAQPYTPNRECPSSPASSLAQTRSRKSVTPTLGYGPRGAAGSSEENGRAAAGGGSWTRSGRSYGGVVSDGSGASLHEKRGGRRGHGSGHSASSRLSGVSGTSAVDARDGGLSPSSPGRGGGHRGALGGSGRLRPRSRTTGCGANVGNQRAGALAAALAVSDDSVEMRDVSGLRSAAARRPSPDEAAPESASKRSAAISDGGAHVESPWSGSSKSTSSAPQGYRTSAARWGGTGGKRRFFALSQGADAGGADAMEVDSGEARVWTQQGRWDEEQGEDGSDGDGGRGSGDVGGVPSEGMKGDDDGDLSLVAAGQDVIHAHRMVLSLRSEPMRAMLRSGMRESFAADTLVKDVRPPVFYSLLTYLYTDTLQLECPEDIMELLVVANQYTLVDLVSLCEGFLQERLDTDNAVNLYHYADALGMQTFEHRVLTFILRHWRKISRSDEWQALPVELRERADAFRTTATHLFILGQKDHVSWSEAGREVAAWVHDRACSRHQTAGRSRAGYRIPIDQRPPWR